MGLTRVVRPTTKILDASGETGVSQPISTGDSRHIMVAVSAPLNASLTFKFQGSLMDDAPDFSSAQSPTNHWDYVEAYDNQDSSTAIPGDTGVALDNASAAANTRNYIINAELMKWFSIEITAFTDGSLTAWVVPVND